MFFPRFVSEEDGAQQLGSTQVLSLEVRSLFEVVRAPLLSRRVPCWIVIVGGSVNNGERT